MYASGINKNTKKFAPKLLQRRKPGGGPSPSENPPASSSSASVSKPSTPVQPAVEVPVATQTVVQDDEAPNSKVENTVPVLTTQSQPFQSTTPVPLLPHDNTTQHDDEPMTNTTAEISADNQTPAPEITEPLVQIVGEVEEEEDEAAEPTQDDVEDSITSTHPATPIPTPIIRASPIPTSHVPPTNQQAKPSIVPTVQVSSSTPPVQQVKPNVIPTVQASPVPVSVPILIPTPHSPSTAIPTPHAPPTVRSTIPTVIATSIAEPQESEEEEEEPEPRKRRRITATSRPSYAPPQEEINEDEEMGGLDDIEEVDDDRDEDYEEEDHRRRGEEEEEQERDTAEQQQGQGNESIMTDGLEETSQTGNTIAASINAVLNAETTKDKDKGRGKGKGKQKAKAKEKTPAKPRAPRKKKTANTSTDGTTDTSINPDGEAGESSTTIPAASSKKTRAPRKPRKKTATDAGPSTSIDDNPDAPPPTDPSRRAHGRTRELTPPNAEEIQIVPGIVKMSDLCRDLKIGKKSQRFTELEKIDWVEIVRKQRAKKARIEAARAAGEEIPPPETTEERLDRIAAENVAAQPQHQQPRHAMQVRVVNGQIVLDEDTLTIDRHELISGADGPREIIEESSLTRRVNAGTWGKREKPERWDEESTDRFYEGLGMFGTDFELIRGLFPDRSRRQIKNKFNKEERKDPGRVTKALRERVAVDIDQYSQLTNTTYADARLLDLELEAMRAQHEEEERAAVEAAKELERERRELQDAAAAAAGENVIGVVQPQSGRGRKGKGKQGMFISRHQGGGEEVVLGVI